MDPFDLLYLLEPAQPGPAGPSPSGRFLPQEFGLDLRPRKLQRAYRFGYEWDPATATIRGYVSLGKGWPTEEVWFEPSDLSSCHSTRRYERDALSPSASMIVGKLENILRTIVDINRQTWGFLVAVGNAVSFGLAHVGLWWLVGFGVSMTRPAEVFEATWRFFVRVGRAVAKRVADEQAIAGMRWLRGFGMAMADCMGSGTAVRGALLEYD